VKVYTRFPALVAAIERAGHEAVLLPPEHTVTELAEQRPVRALAIPSLPHLRPSSDIDPLRCGPGYCLAGGPAKCTRRPRASTRCEDFTYSP
jgi:hypothetical protein